MPIASSAKVPSHLLKMATLEIRDLAQLPRQLGLCGRTRPDSGREYARTSSKLGLALNIKGEVRPYNASIKRLLWFHFGKVIRMELTASSVQFAASWQRDRQRLQDHVVANLEASLRCHDSNFLGS